MSNLSLSKSNFIVADTWVLVNCTRGMTANKFSRMLNDLNLTIIVDIYTLVELYNPEWYRLPFIGRTRNASEFLIDHPSVLINPQELILTEIRSYPSSLSIPPISTDLSNLHWSVREYLLKGLFRRDAELTSIGLDLHVWSQDYAKSKANWPQRVQLIIDDAVSNGILVSSADRSIDILASDKEAFLQYLDFHP